MTTGLTWRPREHPLPAAAVAARGPASTRLAAATATRLAHGAVLRAAAGAGWLVVLGPLADLPWADGVTYLGWEAGALVPTTQAVIPGPALVRRALGPRPDDLVVLLPAAALVAPMPRRPPEPAQLAAR